MDSPSTNVAVMYTSENSTRDTKSAAETTQPSIASVLSKAPIQPRIKYESTLPSSHFSLPSTAHQTFDPASMPPPPSTNFNSLSTPDPVLVSDADLLLNLHSPYSASSPNVTRQTVSSSDISSFQQPRNSSMISNISQDFSPPGFGHFPTPSDTFPPFFFKFSVAACCSSCVMIYICGDMVIDTQDVDMSLLGPEMMPWELEYLPHEFDFSVAGFMGPEEAREGG